MIGQIVDSPPFPLQLPRGRAPNRTALATRRARRSFPHSIVKEKQSEYEKISVPKICFPLPCDQKPRHEKVCANFTCNRCASQIRPLGGTGGFPFPRRPT